VIGLAIALGLVCAFMVLASHVSEAGTDAIDQAILQALRTDDGEPRGPQWLQRTAGNLSALGSAAVSTLVVVLASVFLILVRRTHQALLVIACGVGTAIAILAIKDFVGRERPSIVPALEVVHGLSFPSGHSLIASAIYPTLGVLIAASFEERRLKVFVFATAALVALVVGFTRVYLGVHYPADVLGGWMLGIAWAIVCGLVCGRLQREGLVERETPAES
jgi:undecaprenyl-diphosphatase